MAQAMAEYESCLKDRAGYEAFIKQESLNPDRNIQYQETQQEYCGRLYSLASRELYFSLNPGEREKADKELRLLPIKGKLRRLGENASKIGVERLRMKVTRPLCSKFPEQGSITFTSNEKDIDSYDGLFSFAFYAHSNWNTNSVVAYSKYGRGLKAYCEFINTNPFFEKWGVIIYVDEWTYEVIKFLKLYPKVIIAIVKWNQFTITTDKKPNKIEGTVFRTLRFQALEAFPRSTICVRDADTIFNTGEVREKDTENIGNWEKRFIEMWYAEGSPILLGIFLQYLKMWHRDFPFIFPLKRTDAIGKKRFNNIEPAFEDNLTADEMRAQIARFERMVQANPESAIASALVPAIKVAKKQLEELEKKEGKFNNNTKNTQLYFRSPAGVLAGFTNFTNKRPTDIWLYSFDYIVLHYKLYNSPSGKKISNSDFWINEVGKDERIIIFIMLVKYWNITYFLSIAYGDIGDSDHFDPEYLARAFQKKISPDDIITYADKMKQEKMNMPESNFLVKEINVGKTVNQLYKEHFHDFADHYLVWLNRIMGKSEEEVSQNLRNIMNKYPRLESTNFYEDPHRIPRSSLPPLVAGTPSANGGGRKRNSTYKRKNKKSRKHTRRNVL